VKLAYEVLREASPDAGRSLRATVAGDLEVASCTCLQNFWELRLAEAQELQLDLSGIEGVDPDGLATLLGLVRTQLDKGGRVRVQGADDRLAFGFQMFVEHEGLTLGEQDD